MEFIGKFNLNDNPELESLMDHSLKPLQMKIDRLLMKL